MEEARLHRSLLPAEGNVYIPVIGLRGNAQGEYSESETIIGKSRRNPNKKPSRKVPVNDKRGTLLFEELITESECHTIRNVLEIIHEARASRASRNRETPQALFAFRKIKHLLAHRDEFLDSRFGKIRNFFLCKFLTKGPVVKIDIRMRAHKILLPMETEMGSDCSGTHKASTIYMKKGVLSSSEQSPVHPIISIVGPTASGKSSLAIEIARRWDGEIVSADSRQIYRGMDIGTGKVTKEEQAEVRHHLLDVALPNDDYNASHFLRDARAALEGIVGRKKLPILCGGTGFWVQALVENQQFPDVPPDPALRETLSRKTAEELFKMLQRLDPARAEKIDQRNPRRLIRAIEIAQIQGARSEPYVGAHIGNKTAKGTGEQKPNTNGVPFTAHCPLLILALCPPKSILETRIRTRLEARFTHGMIEEVARLQSEGVSWERLDAFGLEYRWIARYLRGTLSEPEMKERLFFDIVHYAKRQMTWIRRWSRTNPSLHLIETPQAACALAETFLRNLEKKAPLST